MPLVKGLTSLLEELDQAQIKHMINADSGILSKCFRVFIQICHFPHAHTGTLRADVPWENWHSSRFLSHYFSYGP